MKMLVGIGQIRKLLEGEYSYIPEATLTLKTNTTEDLELSFSFGLLTQTDYVFRIVQVSGFTE
ncbi:unnamed protein product [Clavelina lepadiformis]|uniref:Uncharacterized protein n=1 Tax=Clavelina lepadiformis TaxID=159417 RepID=A0ABP0F627_CLALP